MRFLILLFFITSLFACDTSSNSSAYKDYTQAKRDYIQAILDNNVKKKIYALGEIVKCGKFLGFNVSKYQQRLNQLTHKKSIIKKPIKHKVIHHITTKPKKIVKKQISTPKFQNPLKIESNYIKVLSYNPIQIQLSSKMKVLHSSMYSKYRKKYVQIFDIYNAKVSRPIIKKLDNNSLLKIVQNNSKRVRLVIYSNKKLNVKYKKYPILTIHYSKHEKTIVTNISKTYVNFPHYKPKIIVIDPGHGGKDPGGIGYDHIKEKNIVLPLALDLKRELVKRGYKVYITRNTDKFITLRNRTKYANKKHADLFISLHCNIAPHHPEVYGIETYFLSPARSERAKRVAKLENSAIGNLKTIDQQVVLNFLNKNKIIDSNKLGIDIQKSLVYNLRRHYKKIKDGGVRPAPFWVLVGSSMPAILIETGFISNKNEALRLKNRTYQKRYAKFIAEGIDNYFRKNP